MRMSYPLLFVFILAAPLSSEENHPHHHKDKTKESHISEGVEKTEHSKKHHDEKEPKSKDPEHSNHNDEDAAHEQEENHEEGNEEFSSNVGPGLAVLAAEEDKGIQLSDKAQRTLDIRVQPFSLILPQSAIVTSKEETGIYRLRDPWFKLIEGQTADAGNGKVSFRPNRQKDLKKGDQIVINGAALLRVAELDAFAGESAGHGH